MSKHQSDAAGQDKLGPDYFSYFRREVIDLLSQEDNLLSTSSSHDSRISEASSSFGDSMGPKLSHFKKEKLKALLRQSAVVLSEEVNEMLGPALSIQQLKSDLRSKKNLENVDKIVMNDAEQAPCKKLKSSSSSTSLSAHKNCGSLGSSRVIDDELQFFLENNSEQIEAIVTNLSNELSGKLGHMEQQLEEVLDSVTSNCRPMTFKEKEQLQKMIQVLPPQNLGRVAEIIQHMTDETDSSYEIHIDLDKVLQLHHIRSSEILLYPGYAPDPGVHYRVFHYGLEFKVGNWSFDKANWRETDMINKCWAKFPAPPDPSTLDQTDKDSFARDLLSIECIRTLNEALNLHHIKMNCPDPSSLTDLNSGDESGAVVSRKLGKLDDVGKGDTLSTENSRELSEEPKEDGMFSSLRMWIIALWVISGFVFMVMIVSKFSGRKGKGVKGKHHKNKRRTASYMSFVDRNGQEKYARDLDASL